MFSCGGFRDVNGLLQSSTQVDSSLLDDLPNVFDPVLLVLNAWSLGHNAWLRQIKVGFTGCSMCSCYVSSVARCFFSAFSYTDTDRILNQQQEMWTMEKNKSSWPVHLAWINWSTILSQVQFSNYIVFSGQTWVLWSLQSCTWLIRPYSDTIWNDVNNVSWTPLRIPQRDYRRSLLESCLFTSLSQCDTVFCIWLPSSVSSLPPSLSNQQHQGCCGTMLHKIQIRMVIRSYVIRQIAVKQTFTHRNTYTGIHKFLSFSQKQTHIYTYTLHKTLLLTHCVRTTKLLVSLDYDLSTAMLMFLCDEWISSRK